MTVRTFADIDKTTPAFERASTGINPRLAQALQDQGLPPRRVLGGAVGLDRPRGVGEPENAHMVDPPDPRHPDVAKRLLESGAPTDDLGHPINPRGDTGVQFGRGINNQWGPNQAGDGHITRIGPETGMLELLAGRRSDNNRYATPGGRFDPKHDRVVGDTIGREVREESGLDLDFTAAPISYQGLSIDDRDVNEAYMVTECRRIHLSPDEAVTHQPRAGDDLTSAEFVVITPELLDEMHAIHGQLVTFSVRDLITEQPSLAAHLHPALAAHLGVTNQKTAAAASAGRGATAKSTANAALAAPTTPEVTPTARLEPPTRPAGGIPAARITDPQSCPWP